MRISVFLVGCLLLVRLAAAQSTNATITGRVIDPSNAIVTTARVDVISLETGARVSTETNREGIFAIGVGVSCNLDIGGRTAQRRFDQAVEQPG